MGKKILLADDSITIQKVIELTFSDEDFEVVSVGNGRLAVEKAQELRPDIVLCDIIMPEKDGYEVCDFIKKHPVLSHVPVLLLTGAFEPFDQERAARVGCDGFLAKPFEPQTLIAKVKDLLQSAPRPAGPAPQPVAAPSATYAPAPPPAPAYAPPAAFTAPASAPPEPDVTYIPDEPAVEEAPLELEAPAEPQPVDELGAAAGEPSAFASEEPFEGVGGDELMPVSPAEQESLSATLPDSASTETFETVQAQQAWAQPTVEVPLEERAQAGVAQAAVARAAPEPPLFEEVFEEEVAAPEPPAPPAPPAHAPVVAAPPPAAAAAPPAPQAHPAEASFAEVAAPEAAPGAPSVAAEVSVPADQVAQIAQRVVAQISEKVVREVAWEVIPDLAEALIKKEIERLKAELQQT